MSTSNEEARKIVHIAGQYLSKRDMGVLFAKMDDEVGMKTDNESLRQSLAMLRGLVSYTLPPKPAPAWMRPALYGLILVHFALVIAIALSFLSLPFMAPWYIAIPLMTFIFFFSTTRVECQCTNLENRWRARLGMPTISTFVGHYFLKPAYQHLRISRNTP